MNIHNTLFALRSSLFAIILLSGLNLFSQNFNGGILSGVAAAQISGATNSDGQPISGYDHLGVDAGVFVNLYTHKYTSFEMELKYIQKGARSELGIGDTSRSQRYIYLLRLNYIEVPILFKYDLKGLSKRGSDSTYHLLDKLTFEAGLSEAFLLSFVEKDATENVNVSSVQNFRTTDLSGLIGIRYAISDMVQVDFRFCYSILVVRPFNDVPPLEAPPQGIGFWNRLNRGQRNNVLELTLHVQLNKRR